MINQVQVEMLGPQGAGPSPSEGASEAPILPPSLPKPLSQQEPSAAPGSRSRETSWETGDL